MTVLKGPFLDLFAILSNFSFSFLDILLFLSLSAAFVDVEREKTAGTADLWESIFVEVRAEVENRKGRVFLTRITHVVSFPCEMM